MSKNHIGHRENYARAEDPFWEQFGTKTQHFNVHHIIPRSIYDRHKPFLKKVRFKCNEVYNLIMLPTGPGGQKILQSEGEYRALHWQGHEKYNANINEDVKMVSTLFTSGDISQERAFGALIDLTNYVKQQARNPKNLELDDIVFGKINFLQESPVIAMTLFIAPESALRLYGNPTPRVIPTPIPIVKNPKNHPDDINIILAETHAQHPHERLLLPQPLSGHKNFRYEGVIVSAHKNFIAQKTGAKTLTLHDTNHMTHVPGIGEDVCLHYSRGRHQKLTIHTSGVRENGYPAKKQR